jgi:hypothetical protein
MAKVGRPTGYRPEMNQKVDEYLKLCKDEYFQLTKSTGGNSDTFENKLRSRLPNMARLSLFLGVPERTLYDWADRHEEFSQSLGKVKKEQEARLLEMGVSGEYNSTIAKLILSSNHGYKERSDHTSDDKPIPILGDMLKDKKNEVQGDNSD